MAVDGINARKELDDDDDDLVYANYGILHGIRFLVSDYPLLGSN